MLRRRQQRPLVKSWCDLSRPVLERVNKQLTGRQQENNDSAQAIRDRLFRLHAAMMDLRDVLNQAVNNTARAAEVNNVNQETLEDAKVRGGGGWRGGGGEDVSETRADGGLPQRRMDELRMKQAEVEQQLQMAEDDVAQVNDVLSSLHDSKEVRSTQPHSRQP